MHVLVRWTARKYSMNIRKILHTKVRMVKCNADAIFAVLMRYCHRRVATCKILTPKGLIQALRYNSDTIISLFGAKLIGRGKAT